MKNEWIFFLHLTVNLIFLSISLRGGKLLLQVFHVLQIFFANFFVFKQIDLFGMSVTSSDVFAIGAFLSLNLLREFYGNTIAQRAIWSSFFGMVMFVILGQIHLIYTPNVFDETHTFYKALLNPSVRIAIASLITFFLVQKIDLYIFNFLKKITTNYFSTRVFVCLIFSNIIDTIMFSVLALYGIVHSIWPIIVISYAIKMIVTGFSTPFLRASKAISKE